MDKAFAIGPSYMTTNSGERKPWNAPADIQIGRSPSFIAYTMCYHTRALEKYLEAIYGDLRARPLRTSNRLSRHFPNIPGYFLAMQHVKSTKIEISFRNKYATLEA